MQANGDDRTAGGGSYKLFTLVAADSTSLGRLASDKSSDYGIVTTTGVSKRRNPTTGKIIDTKRAQANVKHSVSDVSACFSRFFIWADAAYPFIPSPTISYRINVLMCFNASEQRTYVNVSGHHDGFPDYEVLVQGTLAWHYATPHPGPTLFNLNAFSMGGYPSQQFSTPWAIVPE